MFWIIFAAQLGAQRSGSLQDVRQLFSYEDVPEYLVSAADITRTVYTRTTVRDDGSLQDCAVETSSGDRKLDAYTCAIIVKRGKFAAAKWTDGTPVFSVLRFPITWIVTTGSGPSDEDRIKSIMPDLELSVNQLPAGARKVVDVTLELAADEKGRVLSCDELPPLKADRNRHFPELVPIACAKMKSGPALHPPSAPKGEPMRSMQTALVRFKVNH